MLARFCLLVLVVLACLQYSMSQSAKGPEKCCFNFFEKAIPVRAIKEYMYLSNDCPKNGVIFTTLKSIHVCVNPHFKWVQRAINQLDQKLYNSST